MLNQPARLGLTANVAVLVFALITASDFIALLGLSSLSGRLDARLRRRPQAVPNSLVRYATDNLEKEFSPELKWLGKKLRLPGSWN